MISKLYVYERSSTFSQTKEDVEKAKIVSFDDDYLWFDFKNVDELEISIKVKRSLGLENILKNLENLGFNVYFEDTTEILWQTDKTHYGLSYPIKIGAKIFSFYIYNRGNEIISTVEIFDVNTGIETTDTLSENTDIKDIKKLCTDYLEKCSKDIQT